MYIDSKNGCPIPCIGHREWVRLAPQGSSRLHRSDAPQDALHNTDQSFFESVLEPQIDVYSRS